MLIKVLVVEDNISLNKSIVNILRKEGYTAFSAVDLDCAMEMFLADSIFFVQTSLIQGKKRWIKEYKNDS